MNDIQSDIHLHAKCVCVCAYVHACESTYVRESARACEPSSEWASVHALRIRSSHAHACAVIEREFASYVGNNRRVCRTKIRLTSHTLRFVFRVNNRPNIERI